MSIYTKKGDKGKTSLFDSDSSQRKRVSKDSLKIEAIGSIDELNSYISVVVASTEDKNLQKSLLKVQDNLLRIGSIIAGSNLRFSRVQTRKLEEKIDVMQDTLPVLKNFIIPRGSKVAAHLHFTRSLSRRVERRVVALNKQVKVKPQILMYLNRLSDYFFVLARKVNIDLSFNEFLWRPNK